MKILIQSAADLLQSLQQHFVNVKVKQLNLNDATNQRGSIIPLQERHKKLVTELKKKEDYLEEVKIVGEDAMSMLGRTTAGVKSGLNDIARDIDWLNYSFKTSREQSNEEDHSAVKQKYLEAASAKTRGTVDNLCRTTDELVKLLEDIAKEISGKIERMTRTTDELQESLRGILRELENSQRPVKYITRGLTVLGVVAGYVTGGLAPLVVAAASFVTSHAHEKYLEKEAFKKAQTQWNGYGHELKGSGLLWIIGQKMINEGQMNKYEVEWKTHIVNAGEAFKEMHKDDANSEQIAKKYFKDRMVAYFIFSGLDFIKFLKWLLSLTGSIEFHLNGFINTELAGILLALDKMANDIHEN